MISMITVLLGLLINTEVVYTEVTSTLEMIPDCTSPTHWVRHDP